MFFEKVNGNEIRFKNPGRLLLVVISFIFWGVGFLDLLGHTSADPDLFGLYSLSFFALILLYGATIAIWILLFINANMLTRVTNAVDYIQNRTWLALTIFAAFGAALWVIFEWDRWSRLPGLQVTAFGLVVLAALILLLANWNAKNSRQVWRKVIAYPILAMLALEAVFQILALTGALPGIKTIGGDFYPFERIYYKGETIQNGFANRYGWYLPDFQLDDGKTRILVVGGSYVQSLQVQPEQQASIVLSELINGELAGSGRQVEIVPIGTPGFGLSPFLGKDYMTELPNLIKIDEIIIFFHLGDDFQSPVAAHNAIRFKIDETNEIEVNSDDVRLRHDITHYYMRGYLSLQLVETVRSNYLTPKVLRQLIHRGDRNAQVAGRTTEGDAVDFPRQVGSVVSTYAMTEPSHAGIKETGVEIIPAGNNFLFAENNQADRSEAFEIADNILRSSLESARANNITLRVVTIPMFPDAFYETYMAGDWEPEIEGYDLFLPEKTLIDIAGRYDIPILPMGQYMQQDGLTVEEIRSLFMPGGEGAFTLAGHEYFAEAIYSAFYRGQ